MYTYLKLYVKNDYTFSLKRQYYFGYEEEELFFFPTKSTHIEVAGKHKTQQKIRLKFITTYIILFSFLWRDNCLFLVVLSHFSPIAKPISNQMFIVCWFFFLSKSQFGIHYKLQMNTNAHTQKKLHRNDTRTPCLFFIFLYYKYFFFLFLSSLSFFQMCSIFNVKIKIVTLFIISNSL